MSTQRDELAEIIDAGYVTSTSDCPFDHGPEIAESIIAAGYRKPRTITTSEELDTLPQWSAILDGQGDVAQKLNGRWHFPETAAEGASKVIKHGPVTLIHEPTQ